MLSNHPNVEDKKRLVLVSIFVFFLFSVLILQFYKIQIIEGEKWAKVARKQHEMVIIEPGKRGLFYSNTDVKAGHLQGLQPFVIDVPSFHLYADPQSIPKKCRAQVLSNLDRILNLSANEKLFIEEGLNKNKIRSRKLAMWLSKDVHEEINQWWLSFSKAHKIPKNALFFIQDHKRSYPFGKSLGQVLHAVREDKDLLTHQSIPTGGLELVFNKQLQSKDGKRFLLRSPKHPLDTGKVLIPPENGADIYLTINHCLQAIAEEEIAKAVASANAKGGWAIMMDPHNGEILALAQYPWFDPSSYKQFFNDANLKEHTKVKAITDPFEPGSTMKPMTLAIGLKANEELIKLGKKPIFSPHEKMAIGIGQFPGRKKPLKDLHTHKYLNMYMGLQKSSNVYMAKVIQRVIETMGSAWYRDQLRLCFGFGEKSNIELPGESAGLVPTPGKKHPNGALEWSGATPYSLAMGHNILSNSIQLLKCYAVFANGGFETRPTLIRKIVKTASDGSEEVLRDHTSDESKEKRRVLSEESVKEVVEAMRFVTKVGGTARRANIVGYTTAGKTATTEKIVNGVYSKKTHISTFVGFAPATNPRFVLMIVIDEPEYKYIPGVGKNQHGGQCCAPAFSAIGLRSLQYLGVPPDDIDQKAWEGKMQSLKKLYQDWNE